MGGRTMPSCRLGLWPICRSASACVGVHQSASEARILLPLRFPCRLPSGWPPGRVGPAFKGHALPPPSAGAAPPASASAGSIRSTRTRPAAVTTANAPGSGSGWMAGAAPPAEPAGLGGFEVTQRWGALGAASSRKVDEAAQRVVPHTFGQKKTPQKTSKAPGVQAPAIRWH